MKIGDVGWVMHDVLVAEFGPDQAEKMKQAFWVVVDDDLAGGRARLVCPTHRQWIEIDPTQFESAD